METLISKLGFSLLLIYTFTFYVPSFSFSPIDNYLINCGASLDSVVDNRRFISDSSDSPDTRLSSSRTFSLCAGTLQPGQPQIYHTARVFNAPSKYVFNVKEPGMHSVRLHFHRFISSRLNLGNSQFHVLINELVSLTNFSGGNLMGYPKVMEYLIWVNSEKLEIAFVPARKSNFAFVNAIEVISAPKDLVLETAQYVNGVKVEKFEGLNKQAFEVAHRVTVGGVKVTPFNDSLWRTWMPDDAYLKSSKESTKLYFGGRIKYQDGAASREVGPDNVYNSARLIQSKNASIPNVNLTWEFPVIDDYKYLVRMHFCDIASISLGLLFFNVYVNGHLVYKDLDLSAVANYELASPFYADFVVDADCSGVLSVSVGPSSKSMEYAVDAILNGVEILKMNNSVGSLDGKLPAELLLKCWHRGAIGILLPLIALVCLLMSLSAIMHRRKNKVDAVPWSKLPTDDHEISPKQAKLQLSNIVT
ncbi:CAAX prenyl protease 1-like protein [Hibiscus syriacus]|uniref:CAAX prenyl protease 1-like protein n=1 Tax=Hibiscus syriacus TaxID=106335 RepID=A0A6A3A962_HIBSY|nr:probable receptor-like protein kinase At5g24010 [Hibiscus syriacus]KAE8701001.1 CAAX prenyl protease 1-like protein [Hibiscus syriacus]